MEVLVACALLATVAAALAHVVATAVRVEGEATRRTAATVLAVQKMEQLRSLAWGATLSDLTSDLSVDPPGDGGPGLSPSPAGTLETSTPPYVDYIDAGGRWVGHGSSPPAGGVYTRRWSVEPLPDEPDHTLLIQVAVSASREARGPLPPGTRVADEVRLVLVRTRRGA